MSMNLPVDFDEVRTIGSVTCVPPLGDTMAGVVAFSVEPSALASADDVVAVEGDVGFVVDLLHATATASTPAAVQIRAFRIIRWNSVKREEEGVLRRDCNTGRAKFSAVACYHVRDFARLITNEETLI